MGQEKHRQQAEEALQVSHRFLEIAYNHTEIVPLLKGYMAEIKGYTGSTRRLTERDYLRSEAFHS